MKEKILKLRSEGKTYNQIQETLKCSKGLISYHCGEGQKEKTKKRLRKMRSNKVNLKKVENNSMDDKTWIGGLAELKVMSELAKQRFHVFFQMSGKAPFDLIAYKNNNIVKISVKGSYRKIKTTTNSYEIQIGRVRSNKNKNVIYKFNPYECDIVAVYVNDIDKVFFVKSSDIKNGRVISLREKRSVHGKDSSFIMSESLELKI